jgi:hypothetical protein
MAKKRRKTGNLTPEDEARRAETQRLVRERIAYQEAKAREQDELRARKQAAKRSGSCLGRGL